MIIYNVTVKIDASAQKEWLQWMKDVHIPDVMSTGRFTNYRLCRILGTDESEGITYAVQYSCEDMSTYNTYREEHAPRLQADYARHFKDRYVAFRTLMEVVAEKDKS